MLMAPACPSGTEVLFWRAVLKPGGPLALLSQPLASLISGNQPGHLWERFGLRSFFLGLIILQSLAVIAATPVVRPRRAIF